MKEDQNYKGVPNFGTFFDWRENMKSDDMLLSGSKDMYGIYQAKNTKENEELLKQGLLHPWNENHKVYLENYELIYAGDINRHTTCEQLVEELRTNPPEGFPENGTMDGHVIALSQSGSTEFYYSEEYGAILLEDFVKDSMQEEKYNNTRFFVDIDGVLAKFQQVDTLETLYEKGYFLNLEPVENAINAVKIIKAEHPEIEVFILSSVLSDSEFALQEKNEWLNQYLPEIDMEHRLFPPCGANKASYVPDGIGETDFLWDDYTHNLSAWEPPARGIKLLNGINHTNETWSGNMLRFDKDPRELSENILDIMINGKLIQDLKPQDNPLNQLKEELQKIRDDINGIHKELSLIQNDINPGIMAAEEKKEENIQPVIPRAKNMTSPKL